MKKAVWTLNVGDYSTRITEVTYPLLMHYAEKIGAEFHVIRVRQFPAWPVVYEKLQIHELGRDYDWNIYIDSDALVHPDFFDITNLIQKDTVVHNGADFANVRWTYDRYFRRDGRHIGSCNWFTIASDWCIDLWEPLELPYEQAIKNIHPIVHELATVITPDHLIDDYALSRNIAKYGLKFTTVGDLLKRYDDRGEYLWHQYTLTLEEKIKQLNEMVEKWQLKRYLDAYSTI